MSIIWKIPRQSRFITTSNIFVATFNNPTPGKYNFGVAANTDVVITPIFEGSVYLIERISISGNVSSEIFSNSINVKPQIILKRQSDKQIIYKKPYPIAKFSDNTEIVAFAHTFKHGKDNTQNDNIIASVTGICNQIPATVGLTELKLIVDYHIYAIESTEYVKQFFSPLVWKGDN